MVLASLSSLTASTPAMTSEWPPMNFVADVMLTSTPMSSGLWYRNVRMLLSATDIAPASWAIWVRAFRSQTCILGLVGDSNMRSLVFPGFIAALTALHGKLVFQTKSYQNRQLAQRTNNMFLVLPAWVPPSHIDRMSSHNQVLWHDNKNEFSL